MRIILTAITAKAQHFPRIGGREPFAIHPVVLARMAELDRAEAIKDTQS